MKRDLLIKTACACALCISLGGCWAAVAGAGVGAEAGYVASQEDRTAGETLTDQRITAAVKTKLLADPTVGGLAINVDTFKSHVTLKGMVNSAKEADRAVELAQTVSGVNGVRSKLVVDRES